MPDPDHFLDFRFPGTSREVRRALVRVRKLFLQEGHPKEAFGKIEIVLAEVMNNIVEHALPGVANGKINLNCRVIDKGWVFAICDNGRAMPDGKVPEPQMPDVDTGLSDLPEGGFGWALVHMLAEDITYERIAQRNCLTFRLMDE